MNTFWLKIAGLALVVLGLIVAINVLTGKSGPERPKKTIYDQWEQDDKRLRADPKVQEEPGPGPSVQPGNQGQTVKPTKSEIKPQFKELSPEDKVRAEKLFELAVTQRKMGRLPGMTYKKMVDYCREIIQNWPDSVYAFKARRMLRDIPEWHRERYNITDEEMGISN